MIGSNARTRGADRGRRRRRDGQGVSALPAGRVLVGAGLALCLWGTPLQAQDYPPLSPPALDYFRAADERQKAGDIAGAIDAYRRAIALVPGRADLHYNLAVALDRRGDLPGALAQLQHAVELDPGYADARVYLGTLRQQQGDVAGAIREYRDALRIAPLHAGAHANLGVALKESGDLEGAIREYRRSLEIDPDGKVALHNLRIALREGEEGRKAAREDDAVSEPAERAPAPSQEGGPVARSGWRSQGGRQARARPGGAPAARSSGGTPAVSASVTKNREALLHYRVGQALEAKGDLVRARREYLEASRHDPGFAAARCGLGRVLAKTGDSRGETAALDECLRLEPGNPRAHLIRERLEELRRDGAERSAD